MFTNFKLQFIIKPIVRSFFLIYKIIWFFCYINQLAIDCLPLLVPRDQSGKRAITVSVVREETAGIYGSISLKQPFQRARSTPSGISRKTKRFLVLMGLQTRAHKGICFIMLGGFIFYVFYSIFAVRILHEIGSTCIEITFLFIRKVLRCF